VKQSFFPERLSTWVEGSGSGAYPADVTVYSRKPVQAVPIVSIVDDDESIRLATASLVRSLGWRAQMFASAESFLASPDLATVACIVSDIQMRGMTGVEMQNRLIAQGSTVPIIFITAFPSDEVRQTALANGAAGFMNKPLDAREFVDCLEAVLHRN
jgi:FixJ family two-component response regulator